MEFLTKKQVGEITGYSISRLNSLLQKNEIPIRRLAGGNVRIWKADIYAFMLYNKQYSKCSKVEKQIIKEAIVEVDDYGI